jgi:hypothetical protein
MVPAQPAAQAVSVGRCHTQHIWGGVGVCREVSDVSGSGLLVLNKFQSWCFRSQSVAQLADFSINPPVELATVLLVQRWW